MNRVHPRFGDERPEGLRARATELVARAGEAEEPPAKAAATRLAALYDNLADFEEIADREGRHLAGVRDRVGDAAVAHVPFLATDVHDFDGLREVARLLWASTR